jgi:hypothetical protein
LAATACALKGEARLHHALVVDAGQRVEDERGGSDGAGVVDADGQRVEAGDVLLDAHGDGAATHLRHRSARRKQQGEAGEDASHGGPHFDW